MMHGYIPYISIDVYIDTTIRGCASAPYRHIGAKIDQCNGIKMH